LAQTQLLGPTSFGEADDEAVEAKPREANRRNLQDLKRTPALVEQWISDHLGAGIDDREDQEERRHPAKGSQPAQRSRMQHPLAPDLQTPFHPDPLLSPQSSDLAVTLAVTVNRQRQEALYDKP